MIDAYAYGIDISEWQGDIDLTPYKDMFVIIRAGYWTTEDKCFRNNVRKCQELGIPFGFYWFTEALNEEMAVQEAEAFKKTISGIDPDLGVWVDQENSEYKKANGWKPEENAGDIAAVICTAMQKAGYYTGVYCSKSWLKYVDPECSGFDHWVASWGSNNGKVNDDTRDIGTMLQYTSKLGGKSLDGDICYVSLDHYDQDSNPVLNIVNRIDHEMLIRCMAYLTIAGLFGNDKDRTECLGSLYDEIQLEVNKLYENR